MIKVGDIVYSLMFNEDLESIPGEFIQIDKVEEVKHELTQSTYFKITGHALYNDIGEKISGERILGLKNCISAKQYIENYIIKHENKVKRYKELLNEL